MYRVRVEGIPARDFRRLADAMRYGRRHRGARRAKWVDAHGWYPTVAAVRDGGACYCEPDSDQAIAVIEWVD